MNYALIYKTSGFAENKQLEVQIRNTFKHYDLHASYMTKKKFKTLAAADEKYRKLTNIHVTLAHGGFVVFVFPTEENKIKDSKQLEELITKLNGETIIQNEDTYFITAIIEDACVSLEQLTKLNAFKQDAPTYNAIINTITNPTNVIVNTLHTEMVPLVQQNEMIQLQIMQNTLINKYIYI